MKFLILIFSIYFACLYRISSPMLPYKSTLLNSASDWRIVSIDGRTSFFTLIMTCGEVEHFAATYLVRSMQSADQDVALSCLPQILLVIFHKQGHSVT